jgi:hypothetical protein
LNRRTRSISETKTLNQKPTRNRREAPGAPAATAVPKSNFDLFPITISTLVHQPELGNQSVATPTNEDMMSVNETLIQDIRNARTIAPSRCAQANLRCMPAQTRVEWNTFAKEVLALAREVHRLGVFPSKLLIPSEDEIRNNVLFAALRDDFANAKRLFPD